MRLPDYVLQCISRLESAGFPAFAVGGCVRDGALGLVPHDYDLCTPALPEQICSIFSEFPLVRSGEKHGTVGVVTDRQVVEITTFRTEGNYRDGRHPGWVRFVGDIREDLARRDFTVNAMAYRPEQGYTDPWSGMQDLQNHVLRAVGDPETRFREDALRILRGVRFAVRYRLTPEPATARAMEALAPLMAQLAPERVFDELCRLLPWVTARDLQIFSPILIQVLPELGPCIGFDQHTPHHQFDVYTHIAHVVEAAPPRPVLRWAALLHDVAKPCCFTMGADGRGHFYGHDRLGGQMTDAILLRLKAPTSLREQVVFLVSRHMMGWEPGKKLLRRRLGKYGETAVRDLLELQTADFSGKGTTGDSSLCPMILKLLEEVLAEDACLTVKDLAINGKDLLSLGFFPGPGLGRCLRHLLVLVQDELLPNTRSALLQEAQKMQTDPAGQP